MSGTRCEHCGKMTDAGVICAPCTSQLLDVLRDVPEMIDQLRTTLSRQSKFGGVTVGRSSGETPVVFNTRASDASMEYARTLLRWQGRLADHLQPPRNAKAATPPYRISEPVRFLNPIAAAVWMSKQITRHGIGRWSDAARMVRALVAADEKVEEVIDRPESLIFLGDCEFTDEGQPCAGRVYAERDAAYGECNLCHGKCDAEEQRLKLLMWLDARCMTAAEIARMSTYLGLTIDREQVRKRINQWHKRGHLDVVREDGADLAAELDPEQDVDPNDLAPTFRFADVRRRLENEEEERLRKAKRAG